MGTIETCTLCRKWYDSDDNIGHPECEAEFSNWLDARLCVYCGENDAAGGSDTCATCNADDSSDYTGYPGR